MKQSVKLRNRWKGIIDTLLRFPLTVILLAAASITNIISVNAKKDMFYDNIYNKLLVTFLIGALLYAVSQLFHERFSLKTGMRYLFIGVTILLSAVYYICIINIKWNGELMIRTMVIIFILMISFLWVPVIKSRVNFNESFMASFKGLFMSLFFHGVLFLGIALIISATNLLLVNINGKAYIHSFSIIFIFMAPIYFLSLIPYYPGKEDLTSEVKPDSVVSADKQNEIRLSNREEDLAKMTKPARFLDVLISYVVIPITAIFTVILVLYIITNIAGEFWSNNLMEPLLISYSITVIIVYLLASTINNVFTKYFRKVFPKVLVLVVLFQTLSSILRIRDIGITFGRYYVILFGIFATIAGIWFSIKPVNKNGLIAPVLIMLSLISILPVTDAFTVSMSVQIERLSNTLRKNEMLNGDKITPNSNLSVQDEKTIITSVQYLNYMDYTKDISWLSDYRQNYNFEVAFGFPMNDGQNYHVTSSISVYRDVNDAIPVQGYDFITPMHYNNGDDQTVNFKINKDIYSLNLVSTPDNQSILLKKNNIEINRFHLMDIIHRFENNNSLNAMRTEDVTFVQDNDNSTITVVVQSMQSNISSSGKDSSIDMYVLVKIK